MELQQLEELLDEHGIGDPGVVSTLDTEIEEFREFLRHEEEDDLSILYLVGTASLFRDCVTAYQLLASMRQVLQTKRAGGAEKFYEDQLKVWRGRRDKSQHDIQYLRIVLGMRQTPRDIDEPQEEEA